MSANITWIDCNHWELEFHGLPNRIPWPAEVSADAANQTPLDLDHLLDAIERLGDEAGEPWASFHAAAERFDDLAEALEDFEIARACEVLDEIEKIHPNTAFGAFHRAQVARHEGREQDAISLYKKAVEKTPRVAPIWNNLGMTLAGEGQIDEAGHAFHNALRLSPNDPVALEGLASIGMLVKVPQPPQTPGGPPQAVYMNMPTFRKMAADHLNQMQEDVDQLLNFGQQMIRENVIPDIGVKALEKALALQPSNPRIIMTLAAGYRNTKQYVQSQELVERYISMNPRDPFGYFHLAQTCNSAGDKAGETAALDRTLQIDPNIQQAIGIRFGLEQTPPPAEKQAELERWAESKKSWMAYMILSNFERTRGNSDASIAFAQKAYEMNPDNEEVLVFYASVLGDVGEADRLCAVLKPRLFSRRYSKRLDLAFAQALEATGRTEEAVGVLHQSLVGDVPEDYRQVAQSLIDAWTGVLAVGDIRVELHARGYLRRAVLLALDDGDGGVLMNAGTVLPGQAKFPWRTRAPGDTEAVVRLQQGHTGATVDPVSLGAFRISKIEPSGEEATPIECHLAVAPDASLQMIAIQGRRKLGIAWEPAAEVATDVVA